MYKVKINIGCYMGLPHFMLRTLNCGTEHRNTRTPPRLSAPGTVPSKAHVRRQRKPGRPRSVHHHGALALGGLVVRDRHGRVHLLLRAGRAARVSRAAAAGRGPRLRVELGPPRASSELPRQGARRMRGSSMT